MLKGERARVISVGILFLCLIAAGILYIFFGHRIIEDMYNGESIRFLNKIISAQESCPVEEYFQMADKVILSCLAAFVTALVFMYVLFKSLTIKLSPAAHMLMLVFVFIAAFSVRVYRISELPPYFNAVRQHHAAIIARGYYFTSASAKEIPEWRRDIARVNAQSEGHFEPPIMERIAALAYGVAGGEDLAIPRIISSIFWLIGGVFLYALARELISSKAAVFSTLFYLFLPYGINASRSFQPDPLMIMMLLGSLFFIWRYYNKPSLPLWFAAAFFSSLAILVKPVCLFMIFGAFISLAVYHKNARRALTDTKLISFLAVAFLPTFIYYFYGVYVAKFLSHQARTSFIPHLIFSSFYWKGWLRMAGRIAGYPAIAGAFLGIFMFFKKSARALMKGLLAGYFIFGLVFTYHIHTHDYYQLQFIPVIALGLGPLCVFIAESLRREDKRWYRAALIFFGIFILILPVTLRMATGSTSGQEFMADVKKMKDIGEKVNHSSKTIFISNYYGTVLTYYGELLGKSWPRKDDFRLYEMAGLRQKNAEERFNEMSDGYSPEYFVVISLKEFEKQKDLKELLYANFPVIVRNDDYLIFDLRSKKP